MSWRDLAEGGCCVVALVQMVRAGIEVGAAFLGVVEVLVDALEQRHFGETRLQAEEKSRVRVKGLTFETVAAGQFNEPAAVHHRNAVG